MASFMTKRFGSAMLNRTGKSRFISSGTSPTFNAAATLAHENVHNHPHASQPIGQRFPVAICLGFIGVAGGLAMHTAYQQLGRSPSVKVAKKNREMLREVFDPDFVVASSNRFTDKSIFRKASRIQKPRKGTVSDHPDLFTRPREIESLKSVGIY